MLSDRCSCVACYVGIFSIVQILFQEKYENGRFEKGYSIILGTVSLHVGGGLFYPLCLHWQCCSHSFYPCCSLL